MNASAHNQPVPLRVGNRVLRFGERPYIMGIVNVTPDSFSDGGRFFDRQRAVEHALELAEQGADLLDIGGESTRPGSEPVPANEEIRRVVPVIEGICRWCNVPVSIDTTKAVVAREALQAGAAMINDVSALRFDQEMAPLAAASGVPVVLMHMRGVPRTMQQGEIHYRDVVGEIADFLRQAVERAVSAGIAADRLVLDPGIGFGKTPENNLTILRSLDRLQRLGRPLLVGPSRKAFIGKILDVPPEQRLLGTAAAVAAAVLGGAHILRVHDVAAMRQAALVAGSIAAERLLKEPVGDAEGK